MFTLKTIISGADKIINGLRNVKKGDQQTHKVVGDLTEKAATRMRQRAPKRTGKLRDSILAKAVGNMNWEVRSEVPYIWIQAFGTTKKDYPIYPRHKKALYWETLGHPIDHVGYPITRAHPGIKGKPFVEAGIYLAEHGVTDAAKVIQEIYRSIILGGG